VLAKAILPFTPGNVALAGAASPVDATTSPSATKGTEIDRFTADPLPRRLDGARSCPPSLGRFGRHNVTVNVTLAFWLLTRSAAETF
jgi:hypothetical protein